MPRRQTCTCPVARPPTRTPAAERCAPDSPPAMTQSMPSRSKPPRGPRSGSALRNRTLLGHVTEVVEAERVAAGLDAHTHPQVRWPVEFVGDATQPLRPLRKHLIGVLRCLTDHVKHPSMNSPGTSSWNRSLIEFTKISLGALQPLGTSSAEGWTVSLKPGPLVRGSPSSWYFGEPIALSRFDERLRVAVVAPGRHAVAARGRIPRRLGPLDRRLVSHGVHRTCRV